MYIGDYLGRRNLYSPDALAIVDAGKSPHWKFSYQQMNDRANRLANWLRDHAGVGEGDRVGIFACDGVEFLDAFFACGKLGATLTCFNWRLHPRELLQLIQDTTPRVMIFSHEFGEKIAQAQPEAPFVNCWLHIEGEPVNGSEHFETILLASPDTPVMNENVTEEDIACLLFTGGTTGLPKAAQISHRQIIWNTLNTVIHDIQHGDVTVNVFPMFHTGGLFVYTLPLMIMGGTTVLTRRFDPEQILNLLQQYQATFYAGVPTMWRADDVPDADHRAELDAGGLKPVAFLHQRRRAAACTVGRKNPR
jgi:fatty-acyl-CoA synthase